MYIDEKKIIDYRDDGNQFGPVYTLGKIGFRQMRWTDCGPVSNEHAGGWKKGDVRMEELYMQVIVGYLEVQVRRKGNQPVIIFSHHDVDGNVVFRYEQYASGQY